MFSKKGEIKRIFAGKKYEDNKLKQCMIADGFLVPENEDEIAKGKLQYYDKIFKVLEKFQ